jgi:LemA protein
MSTTTWIILGVIVVLILWIIMIYNGLVAMRQRVGQSFADIDVQLKQRHDLIPNLIETVKGYAPMSAAPRRRHQGAQCRDGRARDRRQGRCGKHAQRHARQAHRAREAYPNLKANANFQQLQSELGDLENKLAASRRFFNNAVQEYNTGIQQFPAALLAGPFGFTPKEFFDLGGERQVVSEVPQVKF